VLERERCGDFKVFISPFRIVEIMKNPVMELVECNDMGIMKTGCIE
jgi:hypothetical protein